MCIVLADIDPIVEYQDEVMLRHGLLSEQLVYREENTDSKYLTFKQRLMVRVKVRISDRAGIRVSIGVEVG